MSVLITLNNVSVDSSIMPSLDVASDDAKLAALPSLKFWLQAGAKYRNGASIKERAQGLTISPTQTATQTITDGQFSNGADALVLADEGTYPYLPDNEFTVNKTSWTVAIAFERSVNDSGNGFFTAGTKPPAANDAFLYIGFNSDNNLVVYKGPSAQRLTYITDGLKGKKSLLIVSFDVNNGLTIRLNSQQVARNANDKTALSDGHVRFFANSASSIGISNLAFAGKIGALMIFDTDLTLLQHQKSLEQLETVMMAKYGIA